MHLLVLLALAAPVPGDVTRGFDPGQPFEAGRHRGVDLAAAPGAPVSAACTGPVAFAGRIGSSGGIVTLRCGPWRVTHMPLATFNVRAGHEVSRGAVVGTTARSAAHDGLHLGMRRDGTRFGYVDPLRFLTRRSPPVPLGRAPRPAHERRAPPFTGPPRVGAPRLVRSPHARAPRLVWSPRARAPRHAARTPRLVGPPHAGAARPASLPLAPWPAWAGLALVLAGAGGRYRVRRRAYSNPMVSTVER